MAAYKTGLQEYRVVGSDKSTFGDRIVKMTPITLRGAPQGSMTLSLQGGKVAHLRGEWMGEHNPQIGDYFMVEDGRDGKSEARTVKPDILPVQYLKIAETGKAVKGESP
jgi:hypothetical protein